MATVTGLTAERMIAMENATVIDGDVVGTDLILITRDGTHINAGSVLGPPGPPGPTFIVCTSTTRPTAGPTEEGKAIYEKDTKLVRIWTGTRWRVQERIICASTTRPAMDAADEGVKIYEIDTDMEFTWTNGAWRQGTSFPIGFEMIWPGQLSSIPVGFLHEDGRVLNRVDCPVLFSILGTTWNQGGESGTQFRIPDSRNRVVVGAGQTYGVGSYGGENAHQLTVAEMPAHTHPDAGHQHVISSNVIYGGPGGISPPHDPSSLFAINQINAFMSQLGYSNNQNTGGNGAHNNMQQFASKYVIIRAT